MKKIAVFILIMMPALVSFAQYSDYMGATIPLGKTDKPKYNPSEFGTARFGLEFSGSQLGAVITASAYHWDVMFYCSIYHGPDKGSYGQHYSSVMSTYHYSGRTYLGSYKKNLVSFGMYNGYLIKRFAFGIYLGYGGYETGETYGNPNHVSTWDEVYSVNYTTHSSFVFGVYARWYATKHLNFFYSYKFNTNSSNSSFGIVFNFIS